MFVSQNDAIAYAKWVGGRLPTDEEWQYIAAGPKYLDWPWGNKFNPLLCNHDGNKLEFVNAFRKGESWCAVSYTHLTLPTMLMV